MKPAATTAGKRWTDLLAATYAEVRACDTLVPVAGGGIGTPERAADYISGQWAHAYGLPDMPVDGVLIGTAAMTAKEAHTSPEVKQLLVKTPGIPADAKSDDVFAPQAAHWVPSGKFRRRHVLLGLSHLHADIYELENDYRRMRPSARARHEAPRRARLPPQGNHRRP